MQNNDEVADSGDSGGASGRGRIAGAIAGVVLVATLAVVGAVFFLQSSNDVAYRLDLTIAEPTSSNRRVWDESLCPTSGRSEPGQAALADADYQPFTNRQFSGLFAPKQIVAFHILVSATDEASTSGQLDFEAAWDVGSKQEGGFDEDAGVVCAFVDAGDPVWFEQSNGTDATVRTSPIRAASNEIRNAFGLRGVDPGEKIVIEAWLLTKDVVPDQTGPLQFSVDNVLADDKAVIETQQVTFTLPFFDRFEVADLVLELTDPLEQGQTHDDSVTYEIAVTNPSTIAVASEVILADFVDPTTSVISTSVADTDGWPTACSDNDTGIVCDLGFLNPAERVVITTEVSVADNAERRWSREAGTCDDGLVDLCNRAVVSWKRGPSQTHQIEVAEPSDLPSDATDININKLSRERFYYPNDPVEFTYVVNNLSGDALFDVTVDDSGCQPIEFEGGDTNENNLLDPNEDWLYKCKVFEIDPAEALSVSRVRGSTSDGRSVFAEAVTRVAIVEPGITIFEAGTSDGTDRSFQVTVAGNDKLVDVVVVALNNCDEPIYLDGDLLGDGVLEGDEVWNYRCIAEQGGVRSAVRVYGTDSKGNSVTGRSDETTDPASQELVDPDTVATTEATEATDETTTTTATG